MVPPGLERPERCPAERGGWQPAMTQWRRQRRGIGGTSPLPGHAGVPFLRALVDASSDRREVPLNRKGLLYSVNSTGTQRMRGR